ncbi:MAG: hypothetical protein HDP34_03420 [Clostridia bacterium]|nr:hypothetical protein [Clostridia bacterium]
MKVVTLCGSMRFSRQMQEIATELEIKKGYCVIAPVGDATITLSEEDKESLAKAHFKKIDISDAVYIVNLGGYIGESVSRELLYAKEHGKEIIYHEKIV